MALELMSQVQDVVSGATTEPWLLVRVKMAAVARINDNSAFCVASSRSVITAFAGERF